MRVRVYMSIGYCSAEIRKWGGGAVGGGGEKLAGLCRVLFQG